MYSVELHNALDADAHLPDATLASSAQLASTAAADAVLAAEVFILLLF